MRMRSLAFLLVVSLAAPLARAVPPALAPFEAEPLANAPESLETYDGKILVVAFWASWCRVCHRALPAYIRLVEAFEDKGVALIAISVDEEKDDAVRHLAEAKYPVPVYWDTQGLKSSLMLAGVPSILVFKNDRQVMHFGGHDERRERKLVRMLTKWTTPKAPPSSP